MVQRELTMHEPAVHRIRLQGTRDGTWAECLGAGSRVQVSEQTPGASTTTLTDIVSDQAALPKLLNSLYDIG